MLVDLLLVWGKLCNFLQVFDYSNFKGVLRPLFKIENLFLFLLR